MLQSARVMTLAVVHEEGPWSSPVYFVYYEKVFYFFSNEASRHIRCGLGNRVSASIFHDSDRINDIFGFQMCGRMNIVSRKTLYPAIVRRYVAKFNFLEKIFGSQVIENRHFFEEKFKSQLYCFMPDRILLSDNSQSSERRKEIDLAGLV